MVSSPASTAISPGCGPFERQGEDYGYAEFYRRVGTVILGSRTYRQALTLGDWPYPGKTAYVLTSQRSPQQAPPNVLFHSGDLKQLTAQIRLENDQDIWLVGGSQVVAGFLNAGLLDELMIFIVPVLLGSGIPLFSGLRQSPELQLVDVQQYTTGIAKLHYRVARS